MLLRQSVKITAGDDVLCVYRSCIAFNCFLILPVKYHKRKHYIHKYVQTRQVIAEE